MGSSFHKPFRLGITGGIGSGKTSVCRVFSILGVPVFEADNAARDIMNNDPGIKQELNDLAGKDLYQGGNLNRQELASIIFNDGEMLSRVNSLVHPVVFSRFEKWAGEQAAPFVIMEAAILFESGGAKLVDRVAAVTAPEEERIERVMKRSCLSRLQVAERLKNQMSDEERVSKSDYVIANAENEMIIPQVLRINNEIKEICLA